MQNAIFTAVSDGGRKLFHGGRREAVHLPLPAGRPHHLPGQVPPFHTMGPGGGGGAADSWCSPGTSAPGRRSWRGCNDLFRNIMSTEFGELDYTQDQALAPGAAFPPEGDWRVELDLDWTCPSWGTRRKGSGRTRICWRPAWRPAVSGSCWTGTLMLTEGERAAAGAEPSDVHPSAALPGGGAPPLHPGPGRGGASPGPPRAGRTSLPTTEVNVALSLLQIVDNPRQDVALIAALRSPVYGFSGDQLALLRAEGGGGLLLRCGPGRRPGGPGVPGFSGRSWRSCASGRGTAPAAS